MRSDAEFPAGQPHAPDADAAGAAAMLQSTQAVHTVLDKLGVGMGCLGVRVIQTGQLVHDHVNEELAALRLTQHVLSAQQAHLARLQLEFAAVSTQVREETESLRSAGTQGPHLFYVREAMEEINAFLALMGQVSQSVGDINTCTAQACSHMQAFHSHVARHADLVDAAGQHLAGLRQLLGGLARQSSPP
jgi:hypothetical protein